MKRDIVWTTKFKKDYKLAIKRHMDIGLLDDICSFFRYTAIWLRFFPPINKRKIRRTTSAASSSIIQKSLLSGSLT